MKQKKRRTVMKLFHYHHWTDHVEETEIFYAENEFKLIGRFGVGTNYHPPLGWDDFRKENPRIRIVEMRLGQVNVTFGQGKKTMFDHIGYLVNEKEHQDICKRAEKLGWHTNVGERRTFIGTPFKLKIELQTHEDAVEDGEESHHSLKITMEKSYAVHLLPDLFGRGVPELEITTGNRLSLAEAEIIAEKRKFMVDPNGVKLIFKTE
jgi:hypothetical protein